MKGLGQKCKYQLFKAGVYKQLGLKYKFTFFVNLATLIHFFVNFIKGENGKNLFSQLFYAISFHILTFKT